MRRREAPLLLFSMQIFPEEGKGRGVKANRDTISPEFSFDFEKRSRILIFSPGYASSVYTCLIDNKNNFKLLHIFSYSFEYYYYFPFLKFEHRVSTMKSTRLWEFQNSRTIRD